MRDLEIMLMVGIPGCGKSTFLESLLPFHYRVNLDSVHSFLAPKTGYDQSNIKLARNIEDMMIEDRLRQGRSVVVDNTNITRSKRQKYIQMAHNLSVDIRAIYFEPDVGRAIRQNEQRERKVPKEAILKMAKDYEAPQQEEGFKAVVCARDPKSLYGDRPAIFLDRDGVIFETHVDGKSHFVKKPEDIIYIPNAIAGLQEITKAGYDIFIVSNQGGVGLGYMKETALAQITERMTEDLRNNGISIKGTYYCIHAPKIDCVCRKPNTGLIIRAAIENDIDPTKSYMIGDMTSDIELGKRVYATTILVGTGFAGSDRKYSTIPDYYADDLLAASQIITNLNQTDR